MYSSDEGSSRIGNGPTTGPAISTLGSYLQMRVSKRHFLEHLLCSQHLESTEVSTDKEHAAHGAGRQHNGYTARSVSLSTEFHA